jgi:hypothetical protein
MRLMNNIIHSGLRIPHFGDDPRPNFTCNFGTIPAQFMPSAMGYPKPTWSLKAVQQT